MIYDKVKKDR